VPSIHWDEEAPNQVNGHVMTGKAAGIVATRVNACERVQRPGDTWCMAGGLVVPHSAHPHTSMPLGAVCAWRDSALPMESWEMRRRAGTRHQHHHHAAGRAPRDASGSPHSWKRSEAVGVGLIYTLPSSCLSFPACVCVCKVAVLQWSGWLEIFLQADPQHECLHVEIPKNGVWGVLTTAMVLVMMGWKGLRLCQGHDLIFPEYGSTPDTVLGGSWRDRRAVCHRWFRKLETRHLPIWSLQRSLDFGVSNNV
jgi:hypothetical protein